MPNYRKEDDEKKRGSSSSSNSSQTSHEDTGLNERISSALAAHDSSKWTSAGSNGGYYGNESDRINSALAAYNPSKWAGASTNGYGNRSGNGYGNGGWNRSGNSGNGTRGSSGYNSADYGNPENATQALLQKKNDRYGLEGVAGLGNGQPDVTSDNWYSGDHPTSIDMAARIYALGGGKDLMDRVFEERYTQGNANYHPYGSITSQACANLYALGVEIPEGGFTKEYFQQALEKAAPYLKYSDTSGDPKAPGKRASKNEKVAYWLYKAAQDVDRTDKAELQLAGLKEEIAYKAADKERNLSDEEIIASIDWSKYDQLVKMGEDLKLQAPTEFTRAIDFSMDYLPGMCWAARNGGGTGDAFTDAVNARLGAGNLWQYDEEKARKLDVNSPDYDPYSSGSTMRDTGLYYGKYNFSKDEVDGLRGDQNSADQTKAGIANGLVKAEEFTETVESQMEAMLHQVDEDIASGLIENYGAYLDEGADTDAIDAYIRDYYQEENAFNAIRKLNDSLKYGNQGLIDTTRGIDPKYKYANLKTYIQEQIAAKQAAGTPTDKSKSQVGLLEGFVEGVKRFFSPPAADDGTQNEIVSPGNPGERPADQYLKDKDDTKYGPPAPKPDEPIAQRDQFGRVLVRDPQTGAMVPLGTIPLSAPMTASATVSDVPRSSGPYNVPPKSEADEKATAEAEYNRAVSSGVVRDVAAPAVKDTFVFEYPDFERDRMLLINAYEKDGMDPVQAYNSQMYFANAYMSEHFGEAMKLEHRYYDAVNGRADAIQKRDALLKKDPTAADIPENTEKLSDEELQELNQQYQGITAQIGDINLRDMQGQLTEEDEQRRSELQTQADEIRGRMERGVKEPELTENQHKYKELMEAIDNYTHTINDQEVLEDLRKGEELEDAIAFNYEQQDVLAQKILKDHPELKGQIGNGDSNYYQNLMWTVEELTHDYAPDFDAHSSIDYLINEKGYTLEELAPYLDKIISESTENIDALGVIDSEMEKYGISLNDEQKAKRDGLETQLTRNKKEAEYYKMRLEPNFKERVAEMRERLTASIKSGKAEDGMDMLLYAAVDEHLRNPEHDPDYNSGFRTGRGFGPFENNNFNYDAMFAMTDDELDTLLYIRSTLGADAAQGYYDFLTDPSYGRLNTRLYENMIGRTDAFLEEQQIRGNVGKSLGATVGVVAADPLKIGGTLYTIRQLVTGGAINPRHYAYGIGDSLAAIREESKGTFVDLFGEHGGKVYDASVDALMSWYYSMIGAGLGLNTLMAGEGLTAKAVNSFAGSMLQTLPNSYEEARDVVRRGGNNAQAGALMFINGITECLTEAIEVSDVWGAMEAGKSGSKKALIDGLINRLQLDDAGGEALSQIISGVSDDIIMQENSNRNRRIEELVAQTGDREKAVAQANREFWGSVIEAGVIGGFSAKLSQVGGYATGKLMRSVDGRKLVNRLADQYVEEHGYDAGEARQMAQYKAALLMQSGLDQQALMDMGYSEEDAALITMLSVMQESGQKEKEIHKDYVNAMDAKLAASDWKWNEGLKERQGPQKPAETPTDAQNGTVEETAAETKTKQPAQNGGQKSASEAPADLGSDEARKEQNQVNQEKVEKERERVTNLEERLGVSGEEQAQAELETAQAELQEAKDQKQKDKVKELNKRVYDLGRLLKSYETVAKADAEAQTSEAKTEDQSTNEAQQDQFSLDQGQAPTQEQAPEQQQAEQPTQEPAAEEAAPEVQGPQAPEQAELPGLDQIPTMEENRQAIQAAASEAATAPTTPEERAATGRKITALGQAERSGDVKNQAMTITSVFDSFNIKNEQGFPGMAAAAAKKLVSRLGGSKATKLIRSAMTQAVRDGVSQADAMQAIQIAALTDDTSFDGLTRYWMNKDQFAAAIEQARAKIGDSTVLDGIRKTIKDSRIGQAYASLADKGALKNATEATDKAAAAKVAYGEAKKANDEAKAKVEAKRAALAEASAAMDEEVNGDTESALRDAATDVEKAVNEQANLQKAEDNARAAAEEAQKKAKQEQQEADSKTMQEAQAQVEQQEQQEQAAREEAEVQKQQQAQAEAEAAQDQQDHENDKAVSFEEFVEKYYPNATDFERRVIKEVFDARANEAIDSDKAKRRERIIKTIGRLFGVNIEIADTKQNGAARYEGKYSRKTNTITLDKGVTQSDAIYRVALHELTHMAERSGIYTEFSRMLLRLAYTDENGNFNRDQMERDIAGKKQQYDKQLERMGRKGVTMDQASQEIVADLTEEILYNNDKLIDQLVNNHPGIAKSVLDSVTGMVRKLAGVSDPAVSALDATRQRFEKALKLSAKRYERLMKDGQMYSAHPSAEQFSVEQLARANGLAFEQAPEDQYFEFDYTDKDGVRRHVTSPYRLVNEKGEVVTEVTPDMVAKSPMGMLIKLGQEAGTVDEATANAQLDMFARLTTIASRYGGDMGMVWEIASANMFNSIKNNSDTQYNSTVDYGTVCAKTQAMVDILSRMMKEQKRGLDRNEILKVYNEVANEGLPTPCPVCYVFSRWMGVPNLLNRMNNYQERFGSMSQEEINAYIQNVKEKYGNITKKNKNGETEVLSLSKAISKVKSSLESKIEKRNEKYTKAKTDKQKEKINAEIESLQTQLAEVDAYNWVTQVLCTETSEGSDEYVIDPNYKPVPPEVLFDLNNVGEFAAKFPKSWRYRNTRGNAMGKAIMPYTGAQIGDVLKPRSNEGQIRWEEQDNPLFTGDWAKARGYLRNAIERMRAQNLIGGQRFQSTSDYRPEWGLDYMMTFLEMQAVGAKGQLYTKVIEAVDMFAKAGIEVNLSLMGKGKGYHKGPNGEIILDFSDVTGIDAEKAFAKTREYSNVQTILVGMSDDHIRAAMKDDRITFIIPWHSSGNTKDTLKKMLASLDETLDTSEATNYGEIERDKPKKNRTEEQKRLWDIRMDILTGKMTGENYENNKALLDGSDGSNPWLSDLYRRFYVDETETETYGVKLNSPQASQIFPYEYWDRKSTIKNADDNGRRFVEYCEMFGITPRFEKFKNDTGYWKLLIDRRMYDLDGNYRTPQQINVTNIDIGMDSIANSLGDLPTTVGWKTEAGGEKKKYGDTEAYERVLARLDDARAMADPPAFDQDLTQQAEDVTEGVQYSFGDDDQYSLPVVDPVEQRTTDENGNPAWIPGHSEAWFRNHGYPIYADVDAEVASINGDAVNGHGTQIASTRTTYGKVFNDIKAKHPNDWQNMRILDASSGLGLGTRLGREMGFNVDDIEPFPSSKYMLDRKLYGEEPEKSYAPMYTDYSALIDAIEAGRVGSYDYIISNAVLNVIPQDTRDNLVVAMGKLLKPGGQMFINTLERNYGGAVSSVPEDQYQGNRRGSVRTQEGDYSTKGNRTGRGHETFVWGSNSVQKVFSVGELSAYLKDALGDGYTIEKAPYGGTGVFVTKDENTSENEQYSLPNDRILDAQIQDYLTDRLGDYGLPIPESKEEETAPEGQNESTVQPRYGGQFPQQQYGTNPDAKPEKSPVQITKKLIKALGIGDYVGTRKMNGMPRTVAGYYERRAKYIAVRSTEAGGFITDMHEIGHAIADRVGMTGTQDMVKNLPAVFAKNYKQSELPDEAFAEFMWRYMADEQNGRQFAGDAFVDDFEQRLEDEGLADAVREASSQLREFLDADIHGKIGAVMQGKGEKRKGTFSDFFRKLETKIDRSAGAERLNSKIRAQTNGDGPSFNEDVRANSLMQNFTAKKAHDLLENTLTDADNNKIGDGLGKVLWDAGIRGDDALQLLNEYMLLKHSLDRDAEGKPVFDLLEFPEPQRKARIDELEHTHPELKDGAAAFQKWRTDFMKAWMVDTGLLGKNGQAILDQWNQTYPDYVPTKRMLDSDIKSSGRRSSGFKVYSAKGSTLDVVNPLDTWCEYVNDIVSTVRQNQTALAFHNAMSTYEGLGEFGRRVTPDMQKVFTGQENVWNDIADALNDGLIKGGIDQDTMDAVIGAINKGLTEYKPNGYNAKDGITAILPDGSKVYYQVLDPELLKLLAVQGEKSSDLVNAMSKTVGRVNKAMSALTTGSNPIFAVRNFMRDYQTSVNYGSWATTYLTGLPRWLSAAYDVWTRGGKYEEYLSMGGGGWTRIDTNSAEGLDELHNTLSGERKANGEVKENRTLGEKIWATVTLEKLNEVIEQASRYAEYKYGQNKTDTEEGRAKAFLAAQDVTVDFARRGDGDLVRGLKQIIPFFGASLQGVYRTGRMFSEGERGMLKQRFLKTVLNTALTSALAAAAMIKFSDDDEKEAFENMSDDLKAGHFYLPNVAPQIFGEQPLIRIPLAQDPLTHAVHGLVTNAVWKGTTDQDIIDVLSIANSIMDNVIPSTRTVFAPLDDIKNNRNWYGSKIIPTRLENLPATAQYTYDTPDLFIAGGRALGMSPLNLQYLAEQYTGFLGQLAIPALSKDKYTGEIGGLSAAIAAAQRRLTSDPYTSTEVTSTFYDNFSAIESVVKTVNQGQPLDQLKRGLTNGEARRAYDEAYKMTHSGGRLYKTRQKITDYYARIEKINANQTLSAEDKHTMILDIRKRMMLECLRANSAVEAYREKYFTGPNIATDAIFKRIREGTRLNLPNN